MKKDKEEEVGWYYFGPWRVHKPFVLDCPSSIKLWKEAWFWVSGNWQRVVSDPEPELDVPGVYGNASAFLQCELKKEELDILREIYGQASEDKRFGKLIRLPKYLIELGQMATKEVAHLPNRPKVVDQPKPTLSRLVRSSRVGEGLKNNKKKEKESLSKGVTKVVSEAKAVAIVTELLQRVLSVTPTRAIVVGDLLHRDLDLQSALEAQAFSRYLPLSWKAFMIEGDMEYLLEASIACSIRATSTSMRSLNALK
ncbi:Uncharacterized protein Adt_18925 [Abeliophyllum distichum]|uniref:Uncharacterized protein n=1 Tax=Abeliophyllum distichum TaxID=126358 RepID=A0ABD1TKS2_9LAMI